ADDEVHAVTLCGGAVFLGGYFQHLANQQRFGLGAFDSYGQLLSFNPSRSPNSRIETLTTGQSLYAGTESPLQTANSSLQWLAAFPDIDAPALAEPLAHVETVPGGTVQFAASLTGQVPIVYQWSFNG